MARATAASSAVLSNAYGASTDTTRSPTGSDSGCAAASSARSTPYLAMSSAALSLSADAPSGLQAGSSALARILRTRSSIESVMRTPVPEGSDSTAGSALGLPAPQRRDRRSCQGHQTL